VILYSIQNLPSTPLISIGSGSIAYPAAGVGAVSLGPTMRYVIVLTVLTDTVK